MAEKPSVLALLSACGVDTAALTAQAAKLVANDPSIGADSEAAAHLTAGVFNGHVVTALREALATELFAPKAKPKK